MKHSNIAIFIPHAGCPYQCSYCNQHTITGQETLPHAQDVQRICTKALQECRSPQDTEIAFFGGSFTAIDRAYMRELLEAAQPFLGEKGFSGIRISTRPDAIDQEILGILRRYGVTAIELGVPSMSDDVLRANGRGHSSADVIRASGLIREAGIELGIQQMMGLYGADDLTEAETIRDIARLKPATVRIYPVVIFRGTHLAVLHRQEKFRPMEFDRLLDMLGAAIRDYEAQGIRVIKCGLHASEFVENDRIAGFYHPALRELAESRLFRRIMLEALKEKSCTGSEVVFAVHPSCVSKAIGHQKSNRNAFEQTGIRLRIVADAQIPKYQCALREVNACT